MRFRGEEESGIKGGQERGRRGKGGGRKGGDGEKGGGSRASPGILWGT